MRHRWDSAWSLDERQKVIRARKLGVVDQVANRTSHGPALVGIRTKFSKAPS